MLDECAVVDSAGRCYGSGFEIDDDGVVQSISPLRSENLADYERILFPAVVDVHCHGGGGFSFPDDIDLDSIRQAVEAHRRGGTTHLVASLVSMKDPVPALQALVKACEQGLLVGIHMEGPYVSEKKPGAQNPAVIRPIDCEELRSWLEIGQGWIKTMTIAPELDNAAQAARLLISYNARPSWGHTIATTAQSRTILSQTGQIARECGLKAPYQTITHLFNAMPGLHHREPGPVHVFTQAARQGVCAVELVGDGIHIDPDLVADYLRLFDNAEHPCVMLITDAMAGAGMADGSYQLGGLDVTIDQGVATLTGTSTIAGGTARLGQEMAILRRHGVAIDTLIRAVSAAPIRALELDIDEKICIGKKLTGVLIDQQCHIQQMWLDGQIRDLG